MFQIAKTKKGESIGSGEFANTPFAKWRKLLSELPSSTKDKGPRKQFSRDTDVGSERELYCGVREGKHRGRYIISKIVTVF